MRYLLLGRIRGALLRAITISSVVTWSFACSSTNADSNGGGTFERGGSTNADGNGVGGISAGGIGASGGKSRTSQVGSSSDGASYPDPPGMGTGNEYHVAMTGADSNDGTSLSTAFRTLQRAVDVVTAGGIIWVHDGQYEGFVVRADQFGSETAWIVMKAYEDEKPVVRGTDAGPTVYFYASSCDESNGLTSGTCDRARWRLEGLFLQGSANGRADGNVVKIDTPDVQLVRNRLCCSVSDVIKNVRTADDTVIVGNEIWQDLTVTTPSGNAQGVDITGADRLLVARNYLHDLTDVGIYAKGNARETRFDANVLVNIGTNGDGNAVMCGQSTDADRLVDGDYETYDCVISNNVVLHASGACVAVGSSQRARVAHNTCIDTAERTHSAIYLTNESEIDTQSKELEIVGNVVYQSNGSSHFSDSSTAAVEDWSTVRIDNNLFFSTNGPPQLALRAGGLDDAVDVDQWRSAFAALGGLGGVFLITDPLFSGASQTVEGLSLSSNSPAVDALECLSYVNSDQLGNMRPQGARCDLGAREFVK